MLSIEYVYVPAGQAFVPYDEIARVLAAATYPPGEDGDSQLRHELHTLQWESSLSSAAQAGVLVRRDRVTGMPTPYAGEIVSIEDLAAWLDGNGSNVRLKVIDPDGHGQTDTPAPVPAKRARTADQDSAILDAICRHGYDPKALPSWSPGAPGVKALVRGELEGKTGLFPEGSKVFSKAWERMRGSGQISDARM
ncbi:MAG: hypothetical protein LBV14_13450 [Acidovorax sp.]|jgi:hypothetical protein|nr:hypothetical protein [Acidovorax sp.]